MSNYVMFLVQLTEKDKRLLIAIFIAFILLFVLVAYIGQGIKAIMKRQAKAIDGYMFELCNAKLVTNPRDFRKQVFRKETKVLYQSTKWALRIFILFTLLFVIYSLATKGSRDTTFGYFGTYIGDLFFKLEFPKGQFFGIKNFPVDWPYVAKKPHLEFSLPAIISYACFIAWIVTVICMFSATLAFIARMNRARVKSVEVFSKSLDEATFDAE